MMRPRPTPYSSSRTETAPLDRKYIRKREKGVAFYLADVDHQLGMTSPPRLSIKYEWGKQRKAKEDDSVAVGNELLLSSEAFNTRK